MKKILLCLIALASMSFALENIEIIKGTVIVKEDINPFTSFRVDDITHLTSDVNGGHYVHLKHSNSPKIQIKEQTNFTKIQDAYTNLPK